MKRFYSRVLLVCGKGDLNRFQTDIQLKKYFFVKNITYLRFDFVILLP